MYVGLDVHKKYCFATVLDQEGNLVTQQRFLNSDEELDRFVQLLDAEAQVALEACGFWEPVYDRLECHGLDVTLAHPLKTRAIAAARIKTDKIDSQTLAHLLRADLLPASYVPDQACRRLRALVRHRATLVRLQTAVKNRIHALLAQSGIQHPFSDLFGKAGLKFLGELQLDAVRDLLLQNYLTVLDVLQTQIAKTSKFMTAWIKDRQEIAVLTSVPGVGTYAAVLILSEIGDVERFPDGKKLCAYAGLVPRVHQSGQTQRYGKITKEGSPWLRWVMIQVVHQTIRTPNALQRFHARLARKKGKKTALVATARKLLTYIYQMLKEEVSFEELRVNQARAPR